jgi:DDE superfamily endonuclease
MDSRLTACVAEHAAHLGGCALSECGGLARTPGGGGVIWAAGGIPRGRGPSRPISCGSPFCHDGTERPIPRPHDATAQKAYYSGKKKRHMLKNLLLINTALRILFLSDTHPGRVHDKRIADTTPYPLPTGSQLLQDLGFQAFTLDGLPCFKS